MSFRDWLDKTLYPQEFARWGQELLRGRVLDRIKSDMTVLDLGAGSGAVRQMNFLGQGATICGVDPDPRVAENRFLDEARVGVGEDIPYDDQTFDLVLSDCLFEHLEDPARVFAEVQRVLKPGGSWLVKARNRRHYEPFFERFSPVRAIQRLRDPESRGPRACYRANTTEAIEGFARRSGLELLRVDLFEGRPETLRGSPITYLAGWAYEKFVNASPRFERYRAILVSELRRPQPVVSNRQSSSRTYRPTAVA